MNCLSNKICRFAICNLQFADQPIKRNLRTRISQKFVDLQLRIESKNLQLKKNSGAATFANLPPLSMILVANCLKSKISWHCPFKLPFACKNCTRCHSCHWKIYPWLNLLKGPPPTHTHTTDVSIFNSGGEGFHVKYRGNVLLWPKSDDSKKCLALFYLFTLCVQATDLG